MIAFWFLVVCSAVCVVHVAMCLRRYLCVCLHTHVVKPCVSVCCIVHIAPAQISEYLLPFLPGPAQTSRDTSMLADSTLLPQTLVVVHQGGELQWRNTTWGGRVEVQCFCFSGVCNAHTLCIDVVCSNLCWLHCEHFAFVAVQLQ